ncbi:hypothetical protein CsSME_00022272 [Camellia sinensis var. sinensis]
MGCAFGLRRWTHSIAQPPPLNPPMSQTTVSSPLVLPEHDHDSINNNIGFQFPRGRIWAVFTLVPYY